MSIETETETVEETTTGLEGRETTIAGASLHVGGEEQETQQQTTHQGPTTEERARQLGWVPKDQYRGDPSKWRSAEDFVKYGEDNRLVLIGETRKLSAALSERDRKIETMEADIGELRNFVSNTTKAMQERKRNDLLSRMKEARAAGDFEGEIAIGDELKKLESAPAPVTQREQQVPAPVQQFMAENPWWGKNRVMTVEATLVAKELAATGAKGQELLDGMTDIMKRRFPEQFKKPNGNGADTTAQTTGNNGRGSAVDGGAFSNGQSTTRRRGTSFADLPPDAQKEAVKFEERFKIKREDYAKQFFEAYGETS